MTKLLFIRQPHVYLPEISAYRTYLKAYHPNVSVFESTDLEHYNHDDYDVLWHFMGIDTKARGKYVVHEYNSSSTQFFARTKNFVKKHINAKPDQRVFLNETVRSAFKFQDNVHSCLRDMGVDQQFFDIGTSDQPDYDFIYTGGLDRGSVIVRCLDHIAHTMPEAKTLLVGDASEGMQLRYQDHPNIIFHGRVPYTEIPYLMSKARYGLNIMPDSYPLNIQTATKVLEYCAVGLPVVTTDYQWINEFESQNDAQFFKLSKDMRNLSLSALDAFEFSVPYVTALSWHNIIKRSGLFLFLQGNTL